MRCLEAILKWHLFRRRRCSADMNIQPGGEETRDTIDQISKLTALIPVHLGALVQGVLADSLESAVYLSLPRSGAIAMTSRRL